MHVDPDTQLDLNRTFFECLIKFPQTDRQTDRQTGAILQGSRHCREVVRRLLYQERDAQGLGRLCLRQGKIKAGLLLKKVAKCSGLGCRQEKKG